MLNFSRFLASAVGRVGTLDRFGAVADAVQTARRPLKASLAVALAAALGSQLGGPAQAASFKASPEMAIELRHAQWFDGEKLQRGTLYIDNGVFTAQRPRKINRLMELRGQTLVPPLAEAHNHNLQSAWGLDKFAQDYLRDGVFYAAMLCADPAAIGPIRDRIAQPDTPDVLFATACITSSDGQPLAMLQSGQPPMALEDIVDKAVLIMDTPEQVEQKWPLIRDRRTDLVKVIMSYHDRPELRGQADQRGRLGVTPEVVAEVVRRAHADGLRVVAHVESALDFEAAVRAGVDFIAELPGYFPQHGEAPESHLISPEAAVMAAEKKIGIVTATVATRLFQPAPDLLARIEDVQKRNLDRLREAGARLLVGSDLFTGNALEEVKHLAQLGVLDKPTLLRLATQDTPRALFPQRKLGCFQTGCEASFLVLAGNPLDDLGALEKPLLRIKQGRVLTQLEEVAATAGTEDNALGSGGQKASGKSRKASAKSSAKSSGKPAGSSKKPATSKATVKKATTNK
ncbi:amidohydrolase family protein [Roseateles amylovorans]|uniref:Amidohydrolase family protein n=1 Tax=Roseateles amylovorans TaxID=2978473 RepID=A0ABY6AVB7_9BURK|nr:amidohydrolase family protein [Roseateles amylovorans]UXH76622.1 amidohydrolase family protein [Roseateles amylovorans]